MPPPGRRPMPGMTRESRNNRPCSRPSHRYVRLSPGAAARRRISPVGGAPGPLEPERRRTPRTICPASSRGGENILKTDNHSGPDPIISRGTARFAIFLFLALFTLGMTLFTWREFHSVPGEPHWIDPVLAVLQTGSPFSAMLVVLYVLFAARFYSRRAQEYSCLRYRQGLEDGRTQAAEQLNQDRYQLWVEWMEAAEVARVEGRPEPEPPPRPANPRD